MLRSVYTVLFQIIILLTSYSQKLDWVKNFGLKNQESCGTSIVTDKDGNVYSIGYFQETIDIDPGINIFQLSSKGEQDIYISKLDSLGNFIWGKSIGSTENEYPNSITIDKFANIYLTGIFGKTVDFDPGSGYYGLSSVGRSDVFILKLNSNGDFVWAKRFGGTSYDYAYELTIDSFNNVYTVGNFRRTVDFDPGAGTYNLTSSGMFPDYDNTFITKLNSNGGFIWAKQITGTNYNYGITITCDRNSDVIIGGIFYGSCDFDPGANIYNLNSINYDNYILKLSSTGNFKWVKSFGGNGDDYIRSLKTDQLNNIFATGNFSDTVKFNTLAGIPLMISLGAEDIFLLKMTSLGSIVWSKQIGGVGYDDAFSLAIDNQENIIIGGMFEGGVDFNHSLGNIHLESIWYRDCFISKLNNNGNLFWAHNLGCNYPFLCIDNHNQIYFTSGFQSVVDFYPGSCTSYLTALGNEDACIVKLKLAELQRDTSYYISCDSFVWIDGITYTSDIDTVDFALCGSYGYDSIVTLNLKIYKSDTIRSEISACNQYTWQNNILTESGLYQHNTTNINGCDSTVFLNLTIIKPDTIHQALAVCDSYIWHNKMYDQSGTYFFDTLSTRSCDSTVILNLTINHSSITQLSQTSCDSLVWHGKTYYDTGIYQYKTQTIAGCDSTIILNLKINKSDKTALSQSACDSYTWNGNTYLQSGTYTYQTINSESCDSIVSLQLIITDHIERSDTINICEGDSIKIFENWISEEGEISGTFTSSAGCDSIQTYKILIDALPVSDIAANICEGDSIFLYRQWFSQPGNYTIRKPNNAACDSLISINITLLPVKNSRDTISICKGDTLNPEGIVIVSDTEIQRVLTSAQSCDSIVHLYIAMLEPALTQRTIKLCPGDSILIAGNWIKADALIEEHLTASNSCDSTSMSEIVLLAEPEAPQYEIDCETREVKLMIEASSDWQILWDNGSGNSETTYKDTKEARVVLSSIPGCSRSFTMSLPQIPDLSLIKLPSDTSVARNIMVNLSLDLDTSEWQLQWYPAGIVDCPTCSSVIITATESTDMILQLTHESGCRYEVNFRIELEEGEIYVPNIFTPDGDGKNDLWKVKIPSDLYMLSCQIFDRWGEMVYRANSGEPIGWDGTFRGKKAQTGVYVYVIEYRNADGESRTIKGDVTVVR